MAEATHEGTAGTVPTPEEAEAEREKRPAEAAIRKAQRAQKPAASRRKASSARKGAKAASTPAKAQGRHTAAPRLAGADPAPTERPYSQAMTPQQRDALKDAGLLP